MRYGIVDAGGGFRGIYACGALDRCLDDGVHFDVAIGVSAGSANLASFVAEQTGRNYRFYTVYGARPQYAGIKNFLTKRTFIDMDYVYGTLSNSDGEDPMDFETFSSSPTDFWIVAAEAETGQARYFSKDGIEKDHYDAMKASCAIPGVCRPYEVDGTLYFDGALGDPIPVEKAMELGCDKVVVLLTRPVDELRSPGSDIKLARLIERKYPLAAEKFRARADAYNRSVAIAKELEAQGKALIVAPDDTCGVSTLTRKKEPLDALYAKGYADGGKIAKFVNRQDG